MNKFIKYIALVFIFLLVYFIYKFSLFNSYDKAIKSNNENYKSIIKNYNNWGTYTINGSSSSEDYIVFNNLKLKNDFSLFIKNETTNSVTYSKDSDTYIEISLDSTFFNHITSYFKLHQFDGTKPNTNLNQLFIDYSVTDDITLLKYVITNVNKGYGFFSGNRELKNFYTNVLMIENFLAPADGFYFIEGKYKGYITYDKSSFNVSILYNDMIYLIKFNNREYFNEKYVQELLNTIVLN